MKGLNIGEVARRSGATPDTIRYYERIGVVPRPPRTPAGYRSYPDGVVNRLIVVRNAQRFGFSLKEIAAFLRTRDAGGKPCQHVRAAAGAMLEAVDRQIAQLTSARNEMERTLKDWDRRLATTPSGQQARLLEHLTPATGDASPPRRGRFGAARGSGRRRLSRSDAS
jgi:DNA-binding transcriptional MerR regulator